MSQQYLLHGVQPTRPIWIKWWEPKSSSSSRFPNLGTIDSWGWIILCSGGCLCMQQHPEPLLTTGQYITPFKTYLEFCFNQGWWGGRYWDNCLERKVLLTVPTSRRHSKPHRATWGRTQLGEEAEIARKEHGLEPLLWLPREGWVREGWVRQGGQVWVSLGQAGVNKFSGLWATGVASSCPVLRWFRAGEILVCCVR